MITALLATLVLQPASLDCPDNFSCVKGEHSYGIARVAHIASWNLQGAEEGREQFIRYFGEGPGSVAVSSGGSDDPEFMEWIHNLPVDNVLVWQEASLLNTQEEPHVSLMRHEVGHKYHRNVFWSDHEVFLESGYGSPAPDWFDEAAAIILETNTEKAERRDLILNNPTKVVPLETLMTSSHPAHVGIPLEVLQQNGVALPEPGQSLTLPGGAVQMDEDNGDIPSETISTGPASIRLTSEQAAEIFAGSIDPEIFYAQSLLLAEYLLDRSDNPLILRSLTEAFVEGHDFDDWLLVQSEQSDLPADMNALQSDWDIWVSNQ